MLANDCVNHICEILPREQMDLLLVGQVQHEIRITRCLFHHVFDRDVLILGTIYVPEVIAAYS